MIRIGTLAVLVAATLLAGPALAQAPETECDRTAQPPRQAMGKLPVFAEGVPYTALRAAAARA